MPHTVRKATELDVSLILALTEKLHLEKTASPANGFLISRYEPKDLLDPISRGEVWIVEEDARLLGFLIVADWLSEAFSATRTQVLEIETLSVDLGAIEKLLWIIAVGVDPTYARSGVGAELYSVLPKYYSEFQFVSAVAEKPKRNEASIRFHLKNGFKRIGTFHRDVFLGLKNYQSGIYFHQ